MSKFKSGDKCAICGAEWEKGKRFANHHIQWVPTELTVILCNNCHQYIHGRNVWPYKYKPGKRKNLTLEDKQKQAESPVKFARKVVSIYREALK